MKSFRREGIDGRIVVNVKGKPYPKYYGIQPTGPYPDQPFVKELYYDGATTQILLQGATRVPLPEPPRYNDNFRSLQQLVDQPERPALDRRT